MRIKEKHEILSSIEAAFSHCRRPHNFIDASHCEECAEHNDTLCNTNRDEIGLKELGNPCWDPMCFVQPQGFVYYFPAMVRLAFDDSTNNEYLNQFLFHCTYEGGKNPNFKHFTNDQVRATADLMRFLKMNWKKKLEYLMATEDADIAVRVWERLEK